jgi:hypothetical protein
VLLMEVLDADDMAAIHEHLRQERALGPPRFQSMIDKALRRPMQIRPPGRPARIAGIDSNAICSLTPFFATLICSENGDREHISFQLK